LGGGDWENYSSRAAQANSSRDAISKITRAKWTGGDSSGRTPALQIQSPEFKLQCHQINQSINK
jgi:hypothetical protein